MIYAAVLPPIGNSQKLQLKWRGPLQITEIINQAMVRIKEINVTNQSANLDWKRNLENKILIPFSYYQDYQKKKKFI